MIKKRSKIQRELTRDERIEEAFHSQRFRFVDTPLPPIPLHRNLNVGDHVELGNLDNCIVVEIRGPAVCLEYDNRPSRDVPNPFPKRIFSAWYWWDTIPEGTTSRDFQGYEFSNRNHVHTNYSQTSFEHLLTRGCLQEFQDNPDYQREYVWSEKDKESFLDSVFRGLDLGKFVLVSYDWPNNLTEVLDGKQRINCATDFLLGRIKFKGKYWWQISWRDRHEFESRLIQYVELNGNKTTRAQRLRLFLEVNASGVPQTEEHLAKVRKLYEDELNKEDSK